MRMASVVSRATPAASFPRDSESVNKRSAARSIQAAPRPPCSVVMIAKIPHMAGRLRGRALAVNLPPDGRDLLADDAEEEENNAGGEEQDHGLGDVQTHRHPIDHEIRRAGQ